MSPNVYTNLGMLKDSGTLGLTNTSNDAQLLRIAEEASRMIDKYCDRYFYIYEGTFYQDGQANRVILDWDVQSVTTLNVDQDYSGQYSTLFNLTSTPVDAWLYPSNILPKTRIEINPAGTIGHFASGIRNGIKIVGVFGYGNDWPSNYLHTAGVTLGAALVSTDATVNLATNSTSEVTAGMTLRVNSEQVYVSALSGALNSTAAIARATNGTTAGTATSGAPVSIYDYPSAIVQATVIQTIRTWKRRESGYVNTIIDTGMGQVQVFKGRDADIGEIINQYRRMRVPRYIN